MSGTRSKRGQDEDSDVEVPAKNLRCSGDEEDKRASLLSPGGSQLMGLNGLRGRSGNEKPAELFRKDLISAMKLADTDVLQDDDFFLISDPWRQEWERGVQVPVNPENIPVANCGVVDNKHHYGGYAFKIPRKLMHAMQDDGFKQGIHELQETHKLAEQVCRYDLDDQDVHWLNSVNDEREMGGDIHVEEWQMEKVMEELESQCHANMQVMIKTVEGLGIEYDENVVCDVCRSPDSEDSNEMVFCDQCDICVHQACYGIQTIPEGNWLCRICTLGIRPTCVLCPKTGGAMKSTKSGSKWSHVSCALWIPEVSIGSPEKMEPITKISQIPSSRWALICSLCRERTGACIQCSVKTCKTAFHVTCAFQHGLEMKTVLEEDEEEIQLKAYCAKHTKKRAEADGGTPRKDPFLTSTGTPKKESEMTEEEKKELRSHRLKKLAEEFYSCVKVPEVATSTQMCEETVDFIYHYWLLKRKSNFNKPLLTPKTEEEDLLSKQQEDCLIARMKMFVHLRQDLERVRNLCYMVTRREKMSRSLNRMKEEVFRRQVLVLSSDHYTLDAQELKSVQTAHKASGEFYDDYDKIFKSAEEACDGQPLITEPIDHKLEHVRLRLPGRHKVNSLREVSVDSDSESQSGRPDRGQRRIHQQLLKGAKPRDLMHARLHQRHRRSRLEHDKEQVDPRKLESGQELIVVRRRHSDQKWVGSPQMDKVAASDNRRSLFNRRRLSDSNIARQKQRIGKYEKRTSLARQKRLSAAGLGPVNNSRAAKEALGAVPAAGRGVSLKSVVKKGAAVKAMLSKGAPSKPVEKNVVVKVEKGSSLKSVSAKGASMKSPATKGVSMKSGVEKGPSLRSLGTKGASVKSEVETDGSPIPPAEKGSSTKSVTEKGASTKQPVEKGSSTRSATDKGGTVKAEANGILPNRKLVVGQSIRERVQSRLHRTLAINGLHDQAAHKIDNFFKSVEQSGGDVVKTAEGRVTPSGKTADASHTDKNSVKQESHQSKQMTSSGDADGDLLCTKLGNFSETTANPPTSSKGSAKDSASEQGATPETRAKRRKIESDMESESNLSDRLFENVDGEVSIRSSRDTTPDRENSGSAARPTRKGVDFKRLSVQRHLDRDLRAHKRKSSQRPGDALEDQVGLSAGGETDSDYADSEGSGCGPRTRRSKVGAEAVDTASVDSVTSSGSKYSTRSRITTEQSAKAVTGSSSSMQS